MLEHVIDKRPQADSILVAELSGEARHHAKWRDLTAAEEGAAAAGLRELAGGRADLLAEVAGLLEGAREGEPDEPLARQAAGLCRKAGADLEAIPAWIAEGRRRTAAPWRSTTMFFRARRPARSSLRPTRWRAAGAAMRGCRRSGRALPGSRWR